MNAFQPAGGHMLDSGSVTPEKALTDDAMSTSTPADEYKNTDLEVSGLAKRLSQQSSWSGVHGNPFEAKPDSALDPHSSNFRSREWAKSMMKLQESQHFPCRTAGIAFEKLNVHGYGEATDYQKSVGNVWLQLLGYGKSLVGLGKKPRRIDILRDFEGLVESGEMLIVLGPPGSGCSSFLKTITGDTRGFTVDKDSYINYQGIRAQQMHKYFRGETIYTAEVDTHFPMLSVSDTLTLPAQARAPRNPPGGVSRDVWAQHLRDVFMATFGITHTADTKVGNDFVRGVSGGERKRVTIAEACLSQSPLQCWDNSTRGLDSANAIEFCRTVRLSTELAGSAACVAIYQAPQSAYDVFDKAIVLYQGRQIFFGRTSEAQRYFENLGFQCPERQTTADFLTSMTSPQERERVIKPGWEHRVPRTPDEFAAIWRSSPERKQLLHNIEAYKETHPFDGEQLEKFSQSRKAQQAKRQRLHSPYTLSYGQQVRLCLWRGFRRLKGDPSISLGQLIGNFVMALILGSVFYNLDKTAESFFQRGAVLFFALLSNAFGSALEILTLFAQRSIVEKHSRYALYHPSAEAVASMLTDMPFKITNAIVFNTTLYFMANLRREPGPFFFFLLVAFMTTMVMSMLFRTVASVSRTISQAMVPAGLMILSIVIFTGFAIPVTYMLGWCRWINYIDPVAYGFESLMVNEFSGQQYPCNTYTPPYGNLEQGTQVCSAIAAVAGEAFVSGNAYIGSTYRYDPAHRWRNVGIMLAFTVFFLGTHLAATEFISEKKSKGEVLVFRRGYTPASMQDGAHDEETSDLTDGDAPIAEKATVASSAILKQTAIFSWRDVCYDVTVKKGEEKRILDHVDGWVKPGTLTALVGVSGAGKTTLLDVLASRKTVGVVSGDMLVDGRQRNSSFQRKTGYVQQQDLHLQTTTVREALTFSALLRQPRSVSRKEKLDYVNEVIKLLNMEDYADAIVGVPGEGLNVEQRKRLTIGVELSAKPELLLFLDEPTSGLDSQTSWAICDLMEKLKNSGQAVLCTVHQPSAMLFQRFDRLLFLHSGGKTVYYGPIGDSSNVMIDYFEHNGAPPCPKDANPAEWMLEVIGAAPGSHSDTDWHQVWRNSTEYREVCHELDRLAEQRPKETEAIEDEESFRPFAAPLQAQMLEVTRRVFSQYWRTPSYIYSKVALCMLSALFIGFVFFKAPLTQQGLQNQMFSIFMLFLISGQLVQQIMPHFVTQRALYEARERPSKTYSWKAFMFANITVELPWNMFVGVIIFLCFYYPIGLYHNAEPTGSVPLRGAQFFLFIEQYVLWVSTFTNLMIAGIEDAEFGGNLANIMFMLGLIFCGVLVRPDALPRFWIFMYRVSPLTYFVEGLLSSGVANQQITCAEIEYLRFSAPPGQTCGEYMQPYIRQAGGYLRSNTSSDCQLCSSRDTNAFLRTVSVDYSRVWRDFGILWVYIIFNASMAVFIYWLARVPKNTKGMKTKEKASEKS